MIAGDTFREWRGDELVWGSTMCEAPGCFRYAEVLADYDVRRDAGVPVCVDDADVLLERQVALAIAQDAGVRAELPDPWELARRPVRRRDPGPSEWEHADRSPEKWLAEQQGVDTSNPDWDVPF